MTNDSGAVSSSSSSRSSLSGGGLVSRNSVLNSNGPKRCLVQRPPQSSIQRSSSLLTKTKFGPIRPNNMLVPLVVEDDDADDNHNNDDVRGKDSSVTKAEEQEDEEEEAATSVTSTTSSTMESTANTTRAITPFVTRKAPSCSSTASSTSSSSSTLFQNKHKFICVQRAPILCGLSVMSSSSSLYKKFQRPMTKRRSYDKTADSALRTCSLGQRRRMDGMSKLFARAGRGLAYKLPNASRGVDNCGSDDDDEEEDEIVKEMPFEPLCLWQSPNDGGIAKGLPPIM